MIIQIFATWDSKAEAFLQPFFFLSKGQAIRSFDDAVNDPKSQMCAHAEDFSLFHLGSFDDADASFDLLKAPVSLGRALEFKKPLEPSLFDAVQKNGMASFKP